MEVSKLEGALLDYWVAKAEGINAMLWANEGPEERAACVLRLSIDCTYPSFFQPSTNWSQGGPIIEREKIDAMFFPSHNSWRAALGKNGFALDSPTPLIAAMRAYVASKFGETVEDL